MPADPSAVAEALPAIPAITSQYGPVVALALSFVFGPQFASLIIEWIRARTRWAKTHGNESILETQRAAAALREEAQRAAADLRVEAQRAAADLRSESQRATIDLRATVEEWKKDVEGLESVVTKMSASLAGHHAAWRDVAEAEEKMHDVLLRHGSEVRDLIIRLDESMRSGRSR